MKKSSQDFLADSLSEAVNALADTLRMVNEITGEACSISGKLDVSTDEGIVVKLDISIGGATHSIHHAGSGLVGALVVLSKFLQADKWMRATGAACMAPTDTPN